MYLQCLLIRPVMLISKKIFSVFYCKKLQSFSIGGILGILDCASDTVLIKVLDTVILWFDENLWYVLDWMKHGTVQSCV